MNYKEQFTALLNIIQDSMATEEAKSKARETLLDPKFMKALIKEQTMRLKVQITTYKGLLVIETIKPDVAVEGWVPIGPGKIGCVIIDTKQYLGISDKALKILKTIKRFYDDIGDIDLFKTNDGKGVFSWIGGFHKIIDPIKAEGSNSYDCNNIEFVPIKNVVPKSAKKYIDEQCKNIKKSL